MLDEGEHLHGEVVAVGELSVAQQRRARIEKNNSTWLSHEACLCVNTKRQRGCSSSHVCTDCVLWVERLSSTAMTC